MLDAVEHARESLCQMIATGELKAGEILPSETELCERFHVSRSSLREAQRMLSVAGVLDSKRGARSRVSGLTPDNVAKTLSTIIPLLPLDSFLELYTLREVLESYSAGQAAAKLTDKQIAELEEVAHTLAATPPGTEAQILDTKFHSLIISGTHDRMIIALMEVLRQRGRDYKLFEHNEHIELKAISDTAHLEITAAIKNRNPQLASHLSAIHVQTTRNWLEKYRPKPELFSVNRTR